MIMVMMVLSVEVENDRQVKKDGSNVGSSGGNFGFNGGVVGVKLDWSNTSSRKIEFLYDNGGYVKCRRTNI